jgi:hypothetical protein
VHVVPQAATSVAGLTISGPGISRDVVHVHDPAPPPSSSPSPGSPWPSDISEFPESPRAEEADGEEDDVQASSPPPVKNPLIEEFNRALLARTQQEWAMKQRRELEREERVQTEADLLLSEEGQMWEAAGGDEGWDLAPMEEDVQVKEEDRGWVREADGEKLKVE